MKVFSVCGVSGSGKTTTIEQIINELRRRNYSVGSVKDIHFEGFTMDVVGKNTYRHKAAGAQLVTARGLTETDVMFNRQLSLAEILRFYDFDYCVLEGFSGEAVPKIITGKCEEDLEKKYDERAFAVSGRIAAEISSYKGLPAINGLTNAAEIVDLIEKKVFDVLPLVDEVCCSKCGSSCKKLCADILSGKAKPSDCKLNEGKRVSLKIGGEDIEMVPFVESILKNNVLAVVKELKGYKKGERITIELLEE